MTIAIVACFSSCISTNVIYDGDWKQVKTSVKDMAETCQKNKFFYENYDDFICYKSISKWVGELICNNLTRPEESAEPLNNMLMYNKFTGEINFYEKFESKYYVYKFKFVDLNCEKYCNLVLSYEDLLLRATKLEKLSKLQMQPTIEKTRSVPYTDYEERHRSVGSYSTGYVYYTETVPVTRYRYENYLAPNPDYNPLESIKSKEKSDQLLKEAYSVKDEIEKIKPFEIYFN